MSRIGTLVISLTINVAVSMWGSSAVAAPADARLQSRAADLSTLTAPEAASVGAPGSQPGLLPDNATKMAAQPTEKKATADAGGFFALLFFAISHMPSRN